MNLYLDDDSASFQQSQLLAKAGHDVQRPADVGLVGVLDAVHLAHAVKQQRVCLTRNYRDFKALHDLVLAAQGHHPGLLIIRSEKDPKKKMKPHEVVRAIANLEAAKVPTADDCITLNHYR
jgi:hypothetical protein